MIKKIVTIFLAMTILVFVNPILSFARTDEIIIPDGPLHPGKLSEITIIVREIGTKALVEAADVMLDGCGIKTSKKTNSKGEALFAIIPTETGKIKITASIKGMKANDTEIPVVPDKSPPPLDIDPVPSPTKNSQAFIAGRTRPGMEVYVGRIKAVVDDRGNFKATVALNEGENHLIVKAQSQYASTTKKFTVTLDSIAPNMIIETDLKKEHYVNVSSIQIKGRVEPGSKVTINGVKAIVVNDLFLAEIPVQPGKNQIKIVAIDYVGNESSLDIEVPIYVKNVIKATIGSDVANVDGNDVKLDAPPIIKNGRTIIPLRFIGEALGAKFDFVQGTKVITITLDDNIIVLTVGQDTATVNGKPVKLDSPPMITSGGRTVVPLRFIAEAFGATVDFNSQTKVVTITREKLP